MCKSPSRQVLIVQRRLPRYRTALFEVLKELLRCENIHLDLLLSDYGCQGAVRGDADVLEWSRVSRCRRLGFADRQILWQERVMCTEHDLVVLQHEAKLASNIGVLLNRRMRYRTTALWGIPTNHWSGLGSYARGQWSGAIRGGCLRLADWYFAYTPLERETLCEKGFPPGRITSLYNAIDTSGGALSVQRIREGGVDGDATCIFLGSLHNGTDLPFLFRACRLIAKERPDFRLIVGGDGELRSVVEGAAHEYTWLDYRGRLEGQAKIEALAQAQLALHPGHIGLSLVELLAAGCVPVLREVAYRGPEVYYAVPGRNCISLGAAAEEKEYAGVVLNLLRNRAVVGELRREAIESTRAVTIENMATHFATGIALALDVGPRSLVT